MTGGFWEEGWEGFRGHAREPPTSTDPTDKLPLSTQSCEISGLFALVPSTRDALDTPLLEHNRAVAVWALPALLITVDCTVAHPVHVRSAEHLHLDAVGLVVWRQVRVLADVPFQGQGHGVGT